MSDVDANANANAKAKAEKKAGFKDTLNLPRTDFPMRANLNQNEPKTLKRWQKEGMYEKVTSARSSQELYRFHDGPPVSYTHLTLPTIYSV